MFGALIGDLFASGFSSEQIDLSDFNLRLSSRGSHFSEVSRVMLSGAVDMSRMGSVAMPEVYAISILLAYQAVSEGDLKKQLKRKAREMRIDVSLIESFVSCGMMIHHALSGKPKSKILNASAASFHFANAVAAFRTASSTVEAIRNAIACSDSVSRCLVAFLAGALAEAYYGLDSKIRDSVYPFIQEDEWRAINALVEASPLVSRRKYSLVLKYDGVLKNNVSDFCDDFITYFEKKDFESVLHKAGLAWTEASMLRADYKALGEQQVLALITGAIRAESFCTGALKPFLRVLPLWLHRLNEFNSPVPGLIYAKTVKSIKIKGESANASEVLECTDNAIRIRSMSGFAKITHEYSFDSVELRGVTRILLDRFSRVLCDDGWVETDKKDIATESDAFYYELTAGLADGSIVSHHGILNRANVPDSYRNAILLFRTVLSNFGFGRIADLNSFNRALKDSEVKYCGCVFSEGGKIYHYRTTDLDICEGDLVIVPVGSDGEEKIVTVETVEFCRWDDTPYPLAKTREIIRRVTDDKDHGLIEEPQYEIPLLNSDF